MKERFSNIPIDSEGNQNNSENGIKQPKEISRRDVLKGLLALGTTVAVGSVLESLIEEKDSSKQDKTYEDEVPDFVTKKEEVVVEKVKDEKKEKAPIILNPLEQLKTYGEIRDMVAGLKVIHDEHYHTLTETENGKNDMVIAIKNISALDIKKMVEPYEKRDLPKELAYMIAIQETRGRVQKSSASARGMMGILPQTALDLGHLPSEANNPYVASEMTAKYLATERDKRFGDNNIDMLLHAYSAGGYLYGFTETVPKKERTAENFYKYMENYINTKFRELKKNGYRHVIEDEKNIEQVSRRFEVPVDAILKANKLTKKSIVRKGSSLVIPFENIEQAIKIVFRKPMEGLKYVPEVKAKYKALKNNGYLSKFETILGVGKDVLG